MMQNARRNNKMPDVLDDRMMRRAVALARKGEGRVEPNPMVGCVIVLRRKVIGEGYHRRFGGPHAEIEALRRCSTDPRGGTVYVSLEPCCHQGKTPPCSDALIAARLARVVVAMRDPNPLVRGRGIRALRAAGIRVDVGVARREANEVIAPYRTRIKLGRPYVIAKWAQSLDGKLATRTGDSRWISCEASRRHVHRLRGRVDAILVGSGTVLADDPMLTARGVALRRQAMRIVLDGRLRLPDKCQLVGTCRTATTLVMTTAARADSGKADRLRRRGVDLIACRQRGGRLSIRDCLVKLAKRGVTNLLVEGGPTVLTALLEADLVDEAFVFTAPMLIGGRDAPAALSGRGTASIEAAITPRHVRTRRVGRDILHRMRFT